MSPVTIEAGPAVLFDGALEPFTSRIWFIDVDAVQVWLHGLPGRARFDDLTVVSYAGDELFSPRDLAAPLTVLLTAGTPTHPVHLGL